MINDTYQFYIISSLDTFLYSKGLIFNNQAQGTWNYYYRNKNIYKEVYFINDTINGIVKTWFDNGSIKSIGYFYGNIPYAHHILYWENGNIRGEYNYNNNGKCVDTQRTFFSSGKLETEQIYPNENFTNDYNYIECDNVSSVFDFEIDSNFLFRGNEWYENGKKKITCIIINRNPYTIKISVYDSLGSLLCNGNIKYSSVDLLLCWQKVGPWVFYDMQNRVYKKEDW